MSSNRRPFIYAHRGASADHPENTVPAFIGAADQGADWVELDVHLSADGGLIVHHDAHYADGRPIPATLAADRPATVPSLDVALDACRGMGVNIEIKQVGDDLTIAELVVDVVTGRRVSRSDAAICISSFDENVLRRTRALEPSIDTAQLLFDLSADPAAVDRAAASGAMAINPWDPFVDAALVSRCRTLGLAVNVWTVDDPERIVELAALGVDGIITNVPGRAIELLS